jgi:hypothetical protein
MGQPYVELEDMKKYLNMVGKDQYDDLIQDALNSATAEVDNCTNRQFNQVDTPTEREFPIRMPNLFHVDDFYSTTGLVVKIDDTVLAEDEYKLHPLNGVVGGKPGWPYWRIKLVNPYRGYCSTSVLKVTALWGWAEVPDPVRQACKIMAAETFQLKDAPFGVAGADNFGSVMRVRENPMAASKLKPYKRDFPQVG